MFLSINFNMYFEYRQHMFCIHTGKCIRWVAGYLNVLSVLHRLEVVDIGKYYIEKHAICQYVHGDICKHLGIDSSTDHLDRYSNLFLNANINLHMHAEYLKMI